MLPRYGARPAAAALAVWVVAGSARAQPARVVIPRVSSPPAIADFLENTPRQAELTIDAFVQREPGDGVPVSQPTTAYLSSDSERLYVVFVCETSIDEPARAHLSARETISADDQVAVLLDTFHDGRRAYRFAANAFGIQSDALLTEGQPDDFTFDALWHSEGRIAGSRFVVWLAIPFRSLRLPPQVDQEWGIALVRTIPRNSEESYWPIVTRRLEGVVPQFATLSGVTAVTGGRNIQMIPFVTVAPSSFRSSPAADPVTRVDARTGLDAKLVVRDALTIDLTVNPDFSQVESDEPQVTTNQRFEVFFPERRPFFIENAGYFLYGAVPAVRNVPETLFFSRRILDPAGGARITGKLASWAIGGLLIQDRAGGTNALGKARIGVARVQRELGRQSTVGVIALSRNTASRTNTVAALDARLKIGPNWVVTGFAGAAATRIAGDDDLSGFAANAQITRTSRRLLYNVFYSDRSPSFRADLGFVPRADVRQIEQYVEYRWRPSRGPVIAVGPNSYFKLNWDRRGGLQEWIVRYPFQIDLKGRTAVFVRRVESSDTFRGVRFRQHLQTVNVNSEWFSWLTVAQSLEGGTAVNFFPPAGVDPALASFLTASLTLSFRPAPRLRVDGRYLFSALKTLPEQSAGARSSIFDNHVTRATLRYQFSRPLSVRAIVDYRATRPNPSLVTLQRARQLTVDVLATYLLHPGTALYGGYTSTDTIGFAEPEAGMLMRTTARQLFLKASYLVRF